MKEGELNKKLPKIFAGKNLRMTQKKASHADLIKKTWHDVLKINACAAFKHKIILSWPYLISYT